MISLGKTIRVALMGTYYVGKSAYMFYLHSKGPDLKAVLSLHDFSYSTSYALKKDGESYNLRFIRVPPPKEMVMPEKALKSAQAAIIMFDLSRRETFSYQTYMPIQTEMERFLRDVPDGKYVLVGNKSDLKEKREVSEDEAREKAKKLGALDYIEISVKDKINLDTPLRVLIDNINI